MATSQQPQGIDIDYGLHYRVWHDDSDEHAAAMAELFIREFGRLLPPPADRRALDVGCGMGFAMIGLQSFGFTKVEGIDIDASQVNACRERGLAVVQVSDSAAYLRERADQFDVILMLDVLEHLPIAEQLPMLVAVRRALRPGGRIILQVPNASSIVGMRWRYIDFTHTSSFTEHSLRFALANAGFASIDIVVPPDPSFPRFPRRIWSVRRWGHFRNELERWLFRWVWRRVIAAEIGPSADGSPLPLGVNLQAVAFAGTP